MPHVVLPSTLVGDAIRAAVRAGPVFRAARPLSFVLIAVGEVDGARLRKRWISGLLEYIQTFRKSRWTHLHFLSKLECDRMNFVCLPGLSYIRVWLAALLDADSLFWVCSCQ